MHRCISRGALCVLLACLILGAIALQGGLARTASASGETVNIWLTTPDQANLLSPQANLTFGGVGSNSTTITVNDAQTYQQMVGFGASLTDSSAWLIYNKMSQSQRNQLMSNLFNPTSGIGLDFLRQPIGGSDLALNEYTYDDIPSGQTDPNLNNFSISHDSAYIIPLLQQALQLNPNLKIMATPWTAPAWMKSNDSLEQGSLNASDFQVYAQYLVDFIKAYQAQGIPIFAITPQNEPGNNNRMPTMPMSASDETNFIANNLGPTFAQNGLSTQILGYDHNWDNPSYPTTILNNSTAASYTSGTAWHCYGGSASAMGNFESSFPNKDTYETECSGGTWEGSGTSANWPNGFQNTMELSINSTRNWAKTVVRWGLALDPNGNPHVNSPDSCSGCRGVVSIDQSTGNVTYNSDYYGLGQFSKFVVPGAYAIASNSFGSGNIEDSAFKNPDGSKVLVVYNGGGSSNTFQVEWNNEAFSYTLPAGAAVTFRWSGTGSTPTPTPTSTPTSGTTTVDDSVQGSGLNQFNYTGSGWGHCTSCDNNNYGFYNASNSWDNTANDAVTVTFNGTQIKFYGVVGPGHGIGAVSLDGGSETMIDFYTATNAGNTLLYTSPVLAPGQHTLKMRVTGNQNSNATWNGINPDRVDIIAGSTPTPTPIPTSTPTPTPTPSGNYDYIVNLHSGLALDDTNGSTSNGTVMQQWALTSGNANQEWSLVSAGSGYYYIINRHSGLALDDTNGSTSNGTLVQQWTQTNGDANQEWSLVSAGNGDDYIVNRKSGLALDDTNGSTSNGTQVQLWALTNGNANQEWNLETV